MPRPPPPAAAKKKIIALLAICRHERRDNKLRRPAPYATLVPQLPGVVLLVIDGAKEDVPRQTSGENNSQVSSGGR